MTNKQFGITSVILFLVFTIIASVAGAITATWWPFLHALAFLIPLNFFMWICRDDADPSYGIFFGLILGVMCSVFSALPFTIVTTNSTYEMLEPVSVYRDTESFNLTVIYDQDKPLVSEKGSIWKLDDADIVVWKKTNWNLYREQVDPSMYEIGPRNLSQSLSQ